MYQQTVELAIDTETDGRIEASELLAMPESDFSALRRLVMAERNARKRGESTKARLLCANCKAPLWLSRYRSEEGNRWFVHDGPSLDCPWYEGNRLSPDLRRALIYRGQQEGARHRKLKEFIASWLEKEPGVTNVNREQVTHGDVLRGEWKRPDVQCILDGKRVVFEIQLSYTFLSEVIKRDDFYRTEGIFIIWVFDALDLRRSTVRDEAFFNRRNVFVLDQGAMDESIRRAQLTFNGTFQRPVCVGNAIEDEWASAPITLNDVQFPTPSYRPFFFDYDTERKALEAKQVEDERARKQAALVAQNEAADRWRQQQLDEWNELRGRYLAAAIAYCDSDYAEPLKQTLLDIADEMYDSDHWHRGFESLRDDSFFGWHKVLPVLLSMKHDRPVGYDKSSSAYRVLEAATRQTVRGRNRAYAVLYLWASYIYKPTLNERQRQWRDSLAKEIKRSVDAGESTFRRDTFYDQVIMLLFPEMEEKLCSPFATDSYIPGVTTPVRRGVNGPAP